MDPVVSRPMNQGISYTAGIYQGLSNPQIRGRTVGLLAVAATSVAIFWCIHRYVVPIFERRMVQDAFVFGIAVQNVVHHLPPAPVDQPVCDIAEEDILRVIELDTDNTSGWLLNMPTLNREEEELLTLCSAEYPELKGSYDELHVINQRKRSCASAVACACMMFLDIRGSLEDEVYTEMFDWITSTEPTLDIVGASLNRMDIESSVKRVDDFEQLKKMIGDCGSACLPICGQHYVMVDKIDDEGVWLRDPSEGRAIVLTEDSFKGYWNRSQEILQVKRLYGKNPSNGSLSG